MVSDVVDGVEIERCPVCKGMYFDEGELDRLAALEAGTGDTFAFSATSDAMDTVPAYCPHCECDMEPMIGPADVRVDRCPSCNGTFLDQGELATLQLHGNG
jgi:Zn-finger nucleic acid-binding protein